MTPKTFHLAFSIAILANIGLGNCADIDWQSEHACARIACLQACAIMGSEVATQDIERWLPNDGGPKSLQQLMAALSHAGLNVAAFRYPDRRLAGESSPLLVVIKKSILSDRLHYATVIGWDDRGNVHVLDGHLDRWIDPDTFSALWTGDALQLAPNVMGTNAKNWMSYGLLAAVAGTGVVFHCRFPGNGRSRLDHAMERMAFCCLSIALLLLAGVVSHGQQLSVPLRVVGGSLQSVSAQRTPHGQLHGKTIVTLKNVDTNTVSLRTPRATCGCIKAELATESVSGGGQTTLAVEVVGAPELGQEIRVDLPTSDSRQPLIRIYFGIDAPSSDNVLLGSASLRLGEVDRRTLMANFYFDCAEDGRQSRWIAALDEAAAKCKCTIVACEPIGDSIRGKERRRYFVQLFVPPIEGSFAISLRAFDARGRRIMDLPTTYSLPPPLSASPGAWIAEIGSSSKVAKRFHVTTANPDTADHVRIDSKTRLPLAMRFRRIEPLVFELEADPSLFVDGRCTARLRIATNTVDGTSLDLPVDLRVMER